MGTFVLQQPITDSILVATGTGVAPMRSYLQWLFSGRRFRPRRRQTDMAGLRQTRHESDIYYRAEFEALAARSPNFHYLPTRAAPKRAGPAARSRQEPLVRIVEERAAGSANRCPRPGRSNSAQFRADFDIYT